jgi:predicted AlkP superfamily pyrophosphatase or phosphodiesterase
MRLLSVLISLTLSCAAAVDADPASQRHVVVVVWDGMRPDFVSAENTPNLWQMAGRGVFFANHHPVYCSSTEVNGTAIATGAYPEHSSIIANKEYRPAIDAGKPVNTEKPEAILHGDEASGGHYLGVSTLAELHDRTGGQARNKNSQIIFEGVIEPASLNTLLADTLGAFPPGTKDKMARDNWTTQALLKVLWKDGVPPYSLLWLAEPDATQHNTGPGSEQSLAAVKNSDVNLGLVLAELEKRGLRDSTDVLVVSDHGFSTIERAVDTAKELTGAGFQAKRSLDKGFKPEDVLVVGNGGSVLLYVANHDERLCKRLCDYLQKQDWAGVVFSRLPVEGTFPLAEAHINSPESPDLLVSLTWNHSRSSKGTPGLFVSDGTERGPGQGQHGSLSRYDMHNTLVAAGPDFRNGVSDPLPSGNTDLAPTILWLLGYKKEASKMDGRVLSEALTLDAPKLESFEIKRLKSNRSTADGMWEQYLVRNEVNGVYYFDEGNGAFARK